MTTHKVCFYGELRKISTILAGKKKSTLSEPMSLQILKRESFANVV